jgi:sulfur-oxidizing protein SoxA
MLLRTLSGALLICIVAVLSPQASADPEADRQAMRDFYAKRFPNTPLEAHKDGVYAIDAGARDQWLEMEDFPPYEIAVDEGAELFEVPFADGVGYADCFGDGAVKQRYPYFDQDREEVVTLEMAINDCRAEHGEDALDFDGADITRLVAFMAFASRGETVDVATPTSDAALAAYESGKRFYTTRRGQLNFACTSCHVQLAGNMLRAERLSASLGQVTHWPVYRFQWQDVGSLHKRFAECNRQVRAEPFAAQSEDYRNLEYFLSYLSNGFELNGPATRK